MKDLSVNNILISGQSPVVQSDIGGEPNQIPLNKDLGSLAYMNAPQIEDINVDTLELREMAAEISDTAVDVFVYDTRKDSDGGAWRSRTQHTSWYNEELNTATRGGRREFPAVAVIVAESDKIIIYDGDDPDLSMWMVFETASNNNTKLIRNAPITCISILNGLFFIGTNHGVGNNLAVANFIKDESYFYFTNGVHLFPEGVIVNRNSMSGSYINTNENAIVNAYTNDVAMTVLPNAPIDSETGLPIPTIAVATDGGVSVIKDNGSVVDSVVTAAIEGIIFDEQNNLLYYRENTTTMYFSSNYSSASFSYDFFRTYGTVPANFTDTSTQNKAISFGKDNQIIVGSDSEGISRLTSGDGVSQVGDDQLAAYTTSTYNTGWMPGDIKLAALSDTKNETVGVDESELVSNGTFDSNTNNWSSTNSTTLSVDNQRLKLQGGGASYPAAYTSVNVVEGVEYEVSAEYISNSNSFSGRIRVSSSSPLGADIVNGDIKTAGTTHINRFTASSTGSVYIALMLQDVNGNSSGIWDNVSVKRVADLVENGTFDNGTTGWETTSVTNSLISVTNEQLTVDRNSVANTASGTHQAINTVIGEQYTVSVDVVSATHFSTLQIVTDVSTQTARDNTNIGGASFTENGKTGTLLATFTATTSVTYVILTTGNDSNATSVFDNVSARLAESDRSVNDNGLQIFGEITKSPVASGADLVAYSGFSADNYLMQPYNSDLDFGTGDFSIMGWVNQPAGQTSYLIDRRSGDNDGIAISINTSNLLYVSIRNGTADVLGGVNFPTGSWAFICFVRRDGIGYIYINGSLLLQGNLDDDASETASLAFGGISYLNTGSCEASLALFRISATVPTDDQIAKIYRDEKPLFQDGAQATLYGTSDAVTALAYDDKTELLHVGTSSGRSDFSGLRRINNTTTAVTTSISASNNLIAEQ